MNANLLNLMRHAGDAHVGQTAQRLAGLAVAVHMFAVAESFKHAENDDMLAGEGLARLTVAPVHARPGSDRTEVVR